MAGKEPLVTVGIMAYNEEKYIADALESILKQDFLDYEILLADNASTDRTGDIVAKYINSGAPIRYFRHAENMGAVKNFDFLVENASGKYFVLAGGHDLWSRDFVSILVEALENNPGAVLAHTQTVWLDELGNVLSKKTGFIDTSGQDIVGRFNLSLWNNQNALYGLYRFSALQKTPRNMDFVGSGAVLMGELALQGDIIHVPQAIWYRRVNRVPENRRARIERYHRTLFAKTRYVFLPTWRIPFAYIVSVLRFRTKFSAKILLLLSATTSLIRYSGGMTLDVIYLLRLDRIFFSGKSKQQ
jgi:glycosyltransferase involved in cell wall biosynthesis